MNHQLITTAGIVLWAILMMVLEHKYPYTPNQKLFRKHFWTDVVWYSAIFSAIFSYLISFATATWLSPWLGGLVGTEKLRFMAAWPFWAQLVFFLVEHDLWTYWFHRLMHSNLYFWRIHEPHHTPREVDLFAGSRAHVFEALIMGFFGYAPMALFGASPEVMLYKGMIDACWGMYIHSNIDAHMGIWQKFINGPEMHRWHHAQDVHNINYATKFAIWDWLWGTAYMPRYLKPKVYGVLDVEWPGDLVRDQLIAFRPFRAHEIEGKAPPLPADEAPHQKTDHDFTQPVV